MPWGPTDPWPSGTPGGAAAPAWGGHIRLWVRAAIAAGTAFHIGPHAAAGLDSGNVLGGAGASARTGPIDRLWVDISCDVMDLTIVGGASSSEGILTKSEAATVTVRIADPSGIFDPLNPDGPFAFGGRSRLTPGVPVEVFAEVADSTATVTTHRLFTGTADSWSQDWTPNPVERHTILVATDPMKVWARFDLPEQSAVGAGETPRQRIARLVAYYEWPGTVIDPPPPDAVTLQATTLAAPGWELLTRVTDDELGYAHFTTAGALRWFNRATWDVVTEPVIVLGCDGVGYNVLIDTTSTALDLQMRNDVHASRAGGVSQRVTNQASVDRYGRYAYQRTDLGVQTDPQSASWAAKVVELYAFPQVTLQDVTFLPALHTADPAAVWRDTLDTDLVADIVRVYWRPPDRPAGEGVVDALNRAVGYSHTISRTAWEVRWQLIAARSIQFAGVIFTLGPHARDRLDAGFVLG